LVGAVNSLYENSPIIKNEWRRKNPGEENSFWSSEYRFLLPGDSWLECARILLKMKVVRSDYLEVLKFATYTSYQLTILCYSIMYKFVYVPVHKESFFCTRLIIWRYNYMVYILKLHIPMWLMITSFAVNCSILMMLDDNLTFIYAYVLFTQMFGYVIYQTIKVWT